MRRVRGNMSSSRRDRARRGRRGAQAVIQAPLDRIIDVLLIAILAVAPLATGGRTLLGRFIYVALVGLFCISWWTKQYRSGQATRWRSSGVEWLLAAGAAVVLLQLVPLPRTLLSNLSPALADLLPMWSPSGQNSSVMVSLGEWRRISLTPHATLIGLCVFAAHVTFFLTLLQWLARLEDVEKILKWLAVAVVFVAGFALVQYLSGTDRFAWTFRHPSRDASDALSGPFANPNHFSNLLALGIGTLIWWLEKVARTRPPHSGVTGNSFRAVKRGELTQYSTFFVMLGLIVLVLAILLARSRGGMLVAGLAAAICIVTYVAHGFVPRRALWGLSLIGVAVLGSLWLHGKDRVETELRSLAVGSIDELDHNEGRRRLWAANWKVARMFPFMGTGVGSHAEVYPLTFEQPSQVEYTHAESCYVQILTETGFAGLGLTLLGVFACLRWCLRSIWRNTSRGGKTAAVCVTAGIAASLLHAVFDFPWYLTSCMSYAIVLAACACRLSPGVDYEVDSGPRPPAGSDDGGFVLPRARRLLLATGFGTVMIAATLFVAGPGVASVYWDQYLYLSLQQKDNLRVVKTRDVSDPQAVHAGRVADYERLREMANRLDRVLQFDPHHARANIRMAAVLLKSFDILQMFGENAMGLAQIRDAALASEFPDTESLRKWLRAAVGNNLALLDAGNYYTQLGLAELPLQGRGYLYGAELAFLVSPDVTISDSLLAQASLVRPYDAAVLFSRGRKAALQGQALVALELWKQSFHRDNEYRYAIMKSMATRIPASAFVQYFDPSWKDTHQLYRIYLELGQEAQVVAVAPLLVDKLEQAAAETSGPPKAHLLLRAVGVSRAVQDFPRAVENASRAVSITPNDYTARKALGIALLNSGQPQAALEEFRWCVRRRPRDAEVQRSLKLTLARPQLEMRVGARPQANPPATVLE